MRQLTIKPRMFGSSFLLVERYVESTLSEFFKKFMSKYAGLSIVEEYFLDKNGKDRIIKTFLRADEVFLLTKEFKDHGWGLKVPFAYDEGGWHYCLSFDKETFGKIILNRWNNFSPEEQFIEVTNSFEELIDGLNERPEHLR